MMLGFGEDWVEVCLDGEVCVAVDMVFAKEKLGLREIMSERGLYAESVG
jgi:hypothetical protein